MNDIDFFCTEFSHSQYIVLIDILTACHKFQLAAYVRRSAVLEFIRAVLLRKKIGMTTECTYQVHKIALQNIIHKQFTFRV